MCTRMGCYPRLLLILMNVFITLNIISCAMQCDGSNSTVIEDLPKKTDLDEYLTSLEKILEFCSRFKQHLEMNLEFGLFLINVNLKPVVRIKRRELKAEIYQRFTKILHLNDILIRYFYLMVKQKPVHFMNQALVKVTTLYSNETLWTRKMPKLTLELLKKTKRRAKNELAGVFSNPNKYKETVYNFGAGVPSPQLSDICLSHLADNMATENKPPPKCKVPIYCRQMLKESTDLGYFISHRLLFFITAHMGRGCVLFSEQEDKSYMTQFCTTMSDEVEYIAMDNYSIKDLLLEDVALCGIVGHAQFLQRQWLSDNIRFQTALGCFSDDVNHHKIDPRLVKRDPPKWKLFRESNEIMDGYCNTHYTGVAASALAVAVRYILEYYY